MRKTFRFFLTWFGLGVVSLLVGLYLLGVAHPGVAHAAAKVSRGDAPDPWAFAVLVVPILMCVPAYFLSRPKQ